MKRGRNANWTALLLSGVVAMTSVAALAQQSGGGGGQQGGGGGQQGGGGGGQQGGGTTPPGGQQPSRPGQQQQQQQYPGQQQQRPGESIDMMERPVYLSGKVMLDDGTPPQEQVIIELLCGGVPRPIGYTDSKGRFSIDLNRSSTMMMPDASVSDTGFPGMGGSRGRSPMGGGIGGGGGIRETDLRGCDLRANLAGFRSDQINLTGRRAFDNPDVGTVILHRLGNVEGFTYSMTSGAAPKDAKKAYEKGLERMKKQKWPEAEEEFRKAVTEYPKYATAWFELGRSLEAQKKIDDARNAYQQAVASDDKFVNPYLPLMTMFGREKKWQEAADMSGKVIKLNPFSFPQAYYIHGVANLNLNNLEVAEKSAREAVKLDQQHRLPRASHLLGIILAEKQDYPGALEQMRGFLMIAPNTPDADNVKKQIDELEKIIAARATQNPQ